MTGEARGDDAPKLNRKQRRAAERAERKAARKARIAASRKTDEQRRQRMRELDDRSPLKPSRGDLIIGPAATRELARIETESKGRRA